MFPCCIFFPECLVFSLLYLYPECLTCDVQQSFPTDTPASRRELELRTRKDDLKARHLDVAQEFQRKQREYLDMEIRKTQRRQLLQFEQLEQRHNQEVPH